ncbi:hypothetical protein NPIL_467421 [Nephila pilipes]|uniref:Uncharacterized protein n=1 Tax=Nephila pilipes TaxID=299642 RepID=A0A8X6TB42_NEPPI|nr:hypothetical protein NPIL_467421 [Nephila pilipes]
MPKKLSRTDAPSSKISPLDFLWDSFLSLVPGLISTDCKVRRTTHSASKMVNVEGFKIADTLAKTGAREASVPTASLNIPTLKFSRKPSVKLKTACRPGLSLTVDLVGRIRQL